MAAVLDRARARGHLGPGPVQHHVDHAWGFVAAVEALGLVDASPTILDLGSGGGVPGLVMAVARPTWRMTLLDGRSGRAAWLREAVDELGLTERVAIVDARAEDAGHDDALRGRFGVVVARSFASPPVTAECAAAFMAVGGHLVVSEPPDARPERWPAAGVQRLGLSKLERVTHAGVHFQVLCQRTPCPAELPRRVGVPVKRPLF